MSKWVLAGSFLLLAVTGIYIAQPSGRYVMLWVRAIHFYAAIAFVCAVVASVATGPRRSAWIFLPHLVMIATGFAIYSASARTDSVMRVFTLMIPFLGGLQAAHLVHHATMWAVAGAGVYGMTRRDPSHTPV